MPRLRTCRADNVGERIEEYFQQLITLAKDRAETRRPDAARAPSPRLGKLAQQFDGVLAARQNKARSRPL
jgi:hypothetical protein